MMAEVLWTPRAERQLEDIGYYIAVEGGRPETAEKVIREIHNKCQLLSTNPLLGESRPELGVGYRSLLYKRWIIIYLPADDAMVIEAVYDSVRDFTRLFRGQ